MKVVKETINNFDNIKTQAIVDPVTADAIEVSKKKRKDVEKAVKEIKAKVTDQGAIVMDNDTKEPKKVKSSDLKKMHLSEELFESYELKTYVLNINFLGFIGHDEELKVDAGNEEDAIMQGKDYVRDNLSVDNVEDMGDNMYEVTITSEFLNAEETYEIEYAEDESDAEEQALDLAVDDCKIEIVDVIDEVDEQLEKKTDVDVMNESTKKVLTEGPGAGYTVEGDFTVSQKDIKITNITSEITPGFEERDDEFYKHFLIDLDCECEFSNVDAQSYYYGGTIRQTPIRISHIELYEYVSGGETDSGRNPEEEPDVYDIYDVLCAAHIKQMFGGGWSHTTFDGKFDCTEEKYEVEPKSYYYGDYSIERIIFEMTSEDDVDYIDRLVTGDEYVEDEEPVDEALLTTQQRIQNAKQKLTNQTTDNIATNDVAKQNAYIKAKKNNFQNKDDVAELEKQLGV